MKEHLKEKKLIKLLASYYTKSKKNNFNNYKLKLKQKKKEKVNKGFNININMIELMIGFEKLMI